MLLYNVEELLPKYYNHTIMEFKMKFRSFHAGPNNVMNYKICKKSEQSLKYVSSNKVERVPSECQDTKKNVVIRF